MTVREKNNGRVIDNKDSYEQRESFSRNKLGWS